MKISKILAGMSAAAIVSSMVAMIPASAVATATPITSVSYNITTTGGDALFTNQFADWSGKSVTLTAGTADYTLSPDAAQTAFTNYGFVNSATEKDADGAAATLEDGISVVVNSMTVNGYEFDDAAAFFGVELTGSGANGNGLMNEWWQENGADITSTDGAATLKFAASGLTLEVEGEEEVVYGGSGDSWNGVHFDSLNDVAFPQWDGIWFQEDYSKEGFVADDTNATVVIKITTDEDQVAGAALIRYVDTTDATTHILSADADGKEFTFEMSVADYKAAIKEVKGDETTQVWDTGFGGNMQFCAAGKVTAYVKGVTYTAAPEESSSEDESSSETDPTPATSYKAFEMFADGAWGWGNWNVNGGVDSDGVTVNGFGTDADVAKDGTYTVSIDADQVAKWYDADGNEVEAGTTGATSVGAEGVMVWNVDIVGLADAVGANSEDLGKDATSADKMALLNDKGITLSDVTLTVDGEDVFTYDDADLLYGDLEANGNVRLEIYNAYGETKESAPEGVKTLATELAANDSIAVTFTIAGLPEEPVEPSSSEAESTSTADSTSTANSTATSSKAASTTTTSNPSTGAAALAAVGVALAGAAVVASKKRK